ncbi:radical SAM domain protein, partial [human gut metagenome]
EKIRTVKGVKKAFIGSGIRYDLFDGKPYLETVLKHHTSGRLKVAPEHTEDRVLQLMRKPPFALFERLNADFHRICDREGLPYQLIPYFISSHPGCTEQEMRALAEKVLGKLHFNLEQVQDLTPTPMTLSSVMFYTGENPLHTREGLRGPHAGGEAPPEELLLRRTHSRTGRLRRTKSARGGAQTSSRAEGRPVWQVGRRIEKRSEEQSGRFPKEQAPDVSEGYGRYEKRLI